MPPIDFNAEKYVKDSVVLERTVSRGMLPNSAKVFRDDNPIHLDENYAKANGFDTTPVHGALMQSYFDLCAMQNGFMLAGSRFNMENAAYPDTLMKFRLEGFSDEIYEHPQFVCEDDKGNILGRLNGRSVENAVLGSPVKIKDKWPLVGSYSHTITEDDVDDFKQLIGIEETETRSASRIEPSVPRALLFSLIPSSLLNLARNDKGNPVGVFKKMYPTFYREAKVGDFEVDVYMQRARASKDGYAYTFMTVCRQDGLNDTEKEIFGDSKVIASGKASVASPVKVEIPKLKVTSQATS